MAILVITRGYIQLNPIKPPFSYGFPMVFPWFSSGNQGAVKIRERRADRSGSGHVLIQFPAQLPPGAAPMTCHGCHGCHGWLGDLRGRIYGICLYIRVYIYIYIYICVCMIYIYIYNYMKLYIIM